MEKSRFHLRDQKINLAFPKITTLKVSPARCAEIVEGKGKGMGKSALSEIDQHLRKVCFRFAQEGECRWHSGGHAGPGNAPIPTDLAEN